MTVTLPLEIPDDLLRSPTPPIAIKLTKSGKPSKVQPKPKTKSPPPTDAKLTQTVLPYTLSKTTSSSLLTSSLPEHSRSSLKLMHGFGTIPSDVRYGLSRVGEAIRKAKRVVVISGAGISTPAIPDFRSANGLFKQIQEEARASERRFAGDGNGASVKAAKATATVGTGTGRGRGRPRKNATEPRLDEEQKEEEGDEEEEHSRSRSSTWKSTTQTPSDMSGIKSGKDLFDVKCFTCPDMLAHHHNLLTRLTELSAAAEPSSFHKLLKGIDDDGRLMRCYTQNIDGLEGKAGLDCRVPVWKAAGNKRRRVNMDGKDGLSANMAQTTEGTPISASQQSTASSSANVDCLLSVPNSQSSSISDFTGTSTPSGLPEPSVHPKCVPLHGLLAALECTRCSYSTPLEERLPLPAEMMDCPACIEERDLRIASAVRPRSVGFLRASVILYNEEHPQAEAIGKLVERDLMGRTKDARVDLLIVAGTTLQIPGVKKMIKEFSKVLKSAPVKRKGKKSMSIPFNSDSEAADDESKEEEEEGEGEGEGKGDVDLEEMPIRTILLNRDPPTRGKAGEWAGVFDVWVQGNLQKFVDDWVLDGVEPSDLRPLPPPVTSKRGGTASPRKKATAVKRRKTEEDEQEDKEEVDVIPRTPTKKQKTQKKPSLLLNISDTTECLQLPEKPEQVISLSSKRTLVLKTTITKKTKAVGQPKLINQFSAHKAGEAAGEGLKGSPPKMSAASGGLATPRKKPTKKVEEVENMDVDDAAVVSRTPGKREIKKSERATYTPKRNAKKVLPDSNGQTIPVKELVDSSRSVDTAGPSPSSAASAFGCLRRDTTTTSIGGISVSVSVSESEIDMRVSDRSESPLTDLAISEDDSTRTVSTSSSSVASSYSHSERGNISAFPSSARRSRRLQAA